MSPGTALLTYALVGIPLGLASGLALGLVAYRSDGWGGYGSFRRRAARLGHVSLLMLPLFAGFWSRMAESSASSPLVTPATVLWIAGGCALSLALFAAAWRRALAWLLPLPALALTTAAVLFALAAWPGAGREVG